MRSHAVDQAETQVRAEDSDVGISGPDGDGCVRVWSGMGEEQTERIHEGQ